MEKSSNDMQHNTDHLPSEAYCRDLISRARRNRGEAAKTIEEATGALTLHLLPRPEGGWVGTWCSLLVRLAEAWQEDRAGEPQLHLNDLMASAAGRKLHQAAWTLAKHGRRDSDEKALMPQLSAVPKEPREPRLNWPKEEEVTTLLNVTEAGVDDWKEIMGMLCLGDGDPSISWREELAKPKEWEALAKIALERLAWGCSPSWLAEHAGALKEEANPPADGQQEGPRRTHVQLNFGHKGELIGAEFETALLKRAERLQKLREEQQRTPWTRRLVPQALLLVKAAMDAARIHPKAGRDQAELVEAEVRWRIVAGHRHEIASIEALAPRIRKQWEAGTFDLWHRDEEGEQYRRARSMPQFEVVGRPFGWIDAMIATGRDQPPTLAARDPDEGRLESAKAALWLQTASSMGDQRGEIASQLIGIRSNAWLPGVVRIACHPKLAYSCKVKMTMHVAARLDPIMEKAAQEDAEELHKQIEAWGQVLLQKIKEGSGNNAEEQRSQEEAIGRMTSIIELAGQACRPDEKLVELWAQKADLHWGKDPRTGLAASGTPAEREARSEKLKQFAATMGARTCAHAKAQEILSLAALEMKKDGWEIGPQGPGSNLKVDAEALTKRALQKHLRLASEAAWLQIAEAELGCQ